MYVHLIFQHNISKLFLGLFLFFSTSIGFSQNSGKLSGWIIEKNNQESVPYASVVLYSLTDSLIKGTLTNETGRFSIDKIPLKKLKLVVNFMGFEPHEQIIEFTKDKTNLDIGKIFLTVSAQLLKEAEVISEKEVVELQIDKKVFNVDKNLQSVGGTAEDALRNIPSLTIDNEGKASVRNSGSAKIYIDGQPTPLELNQIPADQIEKVELITNPSARYEASSQGGIVNIILKKNRRDGYNGSFSAGIGTGQRYNTSFNLNYKINKWNFFTSYSYNHYRNPVKTYTYRTSLENNTVAGYYNQFAENSFKVAFHNARIGLDYTFSKYSKFNISTAYSSRLFDVFETQEYEFLSPNEEISVFGNRIVKSNNYSDNILIQPNWRYSKGKNELIIDLTYNYGQGIPENNFTSFDYDALGNLFPENPYIQNNFGFNYYNRVVGTIDAKKNINDSTMFEYGVRLFQEKKNQVYNSEIYDYTTNTYLSDDFFTIDYNFNDRVYAGYITYNRKNPIWSYQIGLRYEQSNFIGLSNIGDVTIEYNYPSSINDIYNALFPALFLSRKVGKSDIQINFSRKIERPDFFQITPIILFSDRQNIRIGNPAIRPEFINMAELNHYVSSSKVTLLSSIYGKYITNPISLFLSPWDQDTTIMLNSFINGSYSYQYGLDETIKWNPSKNLEFITNTNIYYNKLSSSQVNLARNGWQLTARLNATYKINQMITLQFTGNYRSPQVLLQGERLMLAYLDASVKYSLPDNKSSFVFMVNDVFNSNINRWYYNTEYFIQELARRREIRYFKLVFQYNFGQAPKFKPQNQDIRKSRESGNEND